MKNIFNAIKETIVEIFYTIYLTVENNFYVLGVMIEIAAPYIMWYVGVEEYQRRGYFAVGGELFLPVVILTLSKIIKNIANKRGKGYNLPVARKRFTMEDMYGEVSISEHDIQEIILYLNDVENYIEKRGLDRWE